MTTGPGTPAQRAVGYLRQDQLLGLLEMHEAGVSDLASAYELAERHYFDAVRAAVPPVRRTVAFNGTPWIADAEAEFQPTPHSE